jgi:hypothetical protein
LFSGHQPLFHPAKLAGKPAGGIYVATIYLLIDVLVTSRLDAGW